MGLGRFVQSMFDPRVLAEETVSKQEEMYRKHRELFPNEEPHFHLAQTWRSRAAVHGKNPEDPNIQMVSFSVTMQFACVPPPECARALGLYILYEERRDILEQMTDLQLEFGRLMAPVHEAMAKGTLESLYRKHNPRMAEQMFKSDPQIKGNKR